MILAVLNANNAILKRSLKKIQDFNNTVWNRDLAIPVQCSNHGQLSYEATDVGSCDLFKETVKYLILHEFNMPGITEARNIH